MSRFLSDRWLSEADRLLRGLPPLPQPLTVGYHVIGGPDGDVRYRLILGPDEVGMATGTEADVTLVMAWPLAVEIARGTTSAQRAFLDGRIDLRGEPGVLLGHQQRLAAIDDRLAPLRAETDYGPLGHAGEPGGRPLFPAPRPG